MPHWIVVPCFNEAGRLRSAEFLDFCGGAPEIAFLFVDDASTDATAEILTAMATQLPDRVAVLCLPVNGGKGEAVRAGLRWALTRAPRLVGYLDADLATPLTELARLVAHAEASGASVVLGSRVGLLGHDIRRSARRHYLGRVFATAASAVLGLEVYDTQCGAKVFAAGDALAHALAQPFRTRWVFDVELLQRLVAAEPDAVLVEVPLRQWTDVGGSKLDARAMVLAARDLGVLWAQSRRAGRRLAAPEAAR